MRAIDLHAHILPGVDDGPANLEGSFALARAAVDAGTGQIVATPHINEDHFIEPEDIPPAVAHLNQQLADASINIVVRAGGEIALPRLLDLQESELAGLGLGGGPYLLLESPFALAAGQFEPLIYDVMSRGYRVLLAHPERSPTFQRAPERLWNLVEAGVLVQVTAGALTGAFGDRVRQFSFRLLREELVHVIASDAHDHIRRPPAITTAIRAAERAVPGIGERRAWLTEDVPAAILAGAPIPEAPRLPPARSSAWKRLTGAARR